MVESRYYERKIKYLDLTENGERISGAGFVKAEVKGTEISLAVSVRGLHPTDTYERDVILQAGDGEFVAGRISMKEGQGQFVYHTIMDYSQLQGIRIVLSGAREISCKWQAERKMSAGQSSTGQKAGGQGNTTLKRSGRKDVAQGRPGRSEEEEWGGEGRRNGNQDYPGWEKEKRNENEPAQGSGEQGRSDWERERQGQPGQGSGEQGRSDWERDGRNEPAQGNGEQSRSGWERERQGQPGQGSGEQSSPGQGKEAQDRRDGMQEYSVRADGQRSREKEEREWINQRNMEQSRPVLKGTGGKKLPQNGNTQRVPAGGRKEIQLIPWEEIRAAEESLERVEREVMNLTEKGTVRTTDNSGKDNTCEEGMAGRAVPENRMTGGADREKTKSAERMNAERSGREGTEKGNAERERGNSIRRKEPPVRGKKPVRLMEDKWQQIWAIYPHIRPFQDGREYLSISPADFVLLPGDAYRAANNSFLLHGYYNYEHLILTRIEKRGEISYYIGVPGNYYDREKQVAVMFGFESFECGTEPAQPGDFGYYMMRTQL